MNFEFYYMQPQVDRSYDIKKGESVILLVILVKFFCHSLFYRVSSGATISHLLGSARRLIWEMRGFWNFSWRVCNWEMRLEISGIAMGRFNCRLCFLSLVVVFAVIDWDNGSGMWSFVLSLLATGCWGDDFGFLN